MQALGQRESRGDLSTLRHQIGKSTLVEGMTVPGPFETWINAPALGQKREITLAFDGQRVPATLCRLANARGHVQVKYENRQSLPFREWLRRVFTASRSGAQGEYLELERVEGDVFNVLPLPVTRQPASRLEISEWIFHRSDDRVLQRLTSAREIPAIICNVAFSCDAGQNF